MAPDLTHYRRAIPTAWLSRVTTILAELSEQERMQKRDLQSRIHAEFEPRRFRIDDILKTMRDLHLIDLNGQGACLRHDGRRFHDLRLEGHDGLASPQVEALVVTIMNRGGAATQAFWQAMRGFSWNPGTESFAGTIDDHLPSRNAGHIAAFLEDAGLFIKTDEGLLEVHGDLQDAIRKGIYAYRHRRLSTDQLEVSIHVEELIVQRERFRLDANGKAELAASVQRVSDWATHVGYDIQSYDRGAKLGDWNRFLEVKSSAGKNVEFNFTRNEYEEAMIKRKSYVICFVPRASSAMTNDDLRVQEIRDPAVAVLNHRAHRITPNKELYIKPCPEDVKRARLWPFRRR